MNLFVGHIIKMKLCSDGAFEPFSKYHKIWLLGQFHIIKMKLCSDGAFEPFSKYHKFWLLGQFESKKGQPVLLTHSAWSGCCWITTQVDGELFDLRAKRGNLPQPTSILGHFGQILFLVVRWRVNIIFE